MDLTVLQLAKNYTDETTKGMGAIQGAACTIQSIAPIEGGNRVTFAWEDNEGETYTDTMDVMNGQKGDKGDKGSKGDKGEKGDDGDSFPDAPSDGTTYGRKNGAWTEITGGSGGGIEEAPTDGKIYGRQSSNWTDVGSLVSGYADVTDEATVNDGKYMNSSGGDSNEAWEYLELEASKNDVFKVTTTVNSVSRFFSFFSAKPFTASTYLGGISVPYEPDWGDTQFVDYICEVTKDGTNYVTMNNHKTSGGAKILKLTNEYCKHEVERLCEIPYERKNVLFLGDSITQLGTGTRGWINYFMKRTKPISIKNIAVIGARFCDLNTTTVYDGNPQNSDTSEQNVIGNQIQKIINNRSKFLEDYDLIFIAAGTNDNPTDHGTMTDNEIKAAYFEGSSVKSLANVERNTWAGAARYHTEKLRSLFPTATIVFVTPIHRIDIGGSGWENVRTNSEMLIKAADMASVYCCKAINCGITMNSTMFVDGLHPSAKGAELLGNYIADWFINYYSSKQ